MDKIVLVISEIFKHLPGKHDQKEHGHSAQAAMQKMPQSVIEAKNMRDKVVKQMRNYMTTKGIPPELRAKLGAAINKLNAKGVINNIDALKGPMAEAFGAIKMSQDHFAGKAQKPQAPQVKPGESIVPGNHDPRFGYRPKYEGNSAPKPKTPIADGLKNVLTTRLAYSQAVQDYKNRKIDGNQLKQKLDAFSLAKRNFGEIKSEVRY